MREVGWDIAEKLEWPAEGFIPTAGRNIVVPQGAKEFTVKFSWPVVSAAAADNFHLSDSVGKVVKVMQDVRDNAMDAPAGECFWQLYLVEAVRGNDVLAARQNPIGQTDGCAFGWFVIAVDGGNRLSSFSPEQGACGRSRRSPMKSSIKRQRQALDHVP